MQHPKIPELRSLESPLLQFFLVSPSGHVKRVLFERNLCSPLLSVTWTRDSGGRQVALKRAGINPDLTELGWLELEAVYESEGRSRDFAEYVRWSDHANAVPGAKPFPDSHTPDEVLRRRREYKAEVVAFELAPAQPRKAKAAPKKDGAE